MLVVFKTIWQFFRRNPFLFYLVGAVIAYWPVTFLVGSLQFDMMDVVLPWRVYMSDCLREGILPLWNPYQQLGYPIHADLQYPLWYPEIFLLSHFVPYSNATLHLLFVFYAAMAGWGMYKLALEFSVRRGYALLVGLAYMLSGLFVGHAQSLVSILGAVWLPWVMAYYLRLLQPGFSLKRILWFTFFLFLMLTGGYQAVSIMLFYVLMGFFILQAVALLRRRNFRELLHLLKKHVLVTLILLPLCTGMLFSLYHVFPYLSRLSGVTLASAQRLVFTPQCMVSLLWPFAAVKEMSFFATEGSFTNNFMGSLLLLAGLLGVFLKGKSYRLNYLTGVGLVFLLASFGSYTPVHAWFFYHVPLMNLFKYPVFFRFFFTVAVLLLAGHYLSRMHPVGMKQKTFRVALWVLAGIYLAALGYSWFRVCGGSLTYWNDGLTFYEKLHKAGIWEQVFIQSCIQSLIVAALGLTMGISRIRPHYLLAMAVALELVVAVQLNQFITVCNNKSPITLRNELRKYPNGFPKPDWSPVSANSDGNYNNYVLWRNMGNFTRQVSADAWTSFWFSGFEFLLDSVPELLDSLKTNPVLFLSGDVRSESALDTGGFGATTVYLADSLLDRFSDVVMDTTAHQSLVLSSFMPNYIRCNVQSDAPVALVLLQNNYVGWRVYVDGKLQPHYTVDKTFIGLPLPAGKHSVAYSYNLPDVRLGFWVSMGSFLLLSAGLLWWLIRSRRGRWGAGVGVLIAVLVSLGLSTLRKQKREAWEECQQHVQQQVQQFSEASATGRTFCLVSAADTSEFRHYAHSGCLVAQTIHDPLTCELIEGWYEKHYDTVRYFRINTMENELVLNYLKQAYPVMEVLQQSRNGSQYLFHTSSMVQGMDQAERYPLRSGTRYWNTQPPVDTCRGGEVYYADSLAAYPLGFEIAGSALKESSEYSLNFIGELNFEKPAPVKVGVEVIHNGHLKTYQLWEVPGNTTSGSWSLVFHSFRLPDTFDPQDKIKLYIWNPEGASFRLRKVEAALIYSHRL